MLNGPEAADVAAQEVVFFFAFFLFSSLNA